MAFLDIGFGEFPHEKATHGVDIQPESNLTGLARRYGPVAVKNMKQVMAQKGHFYFNFDYNKTKLPYQNNYFSTVYSSHSLNIFGNEFALKEAIRVLKKGGVLIIRTGSEDPKEHRQLAMELKKHRLKNVAIKPGERRSDLIIGIK
jgi:SAM-dependent methyltransferase